MALILLLVEESKGEDEPVERCGDGRGGGDSVSNGGTRHRCLLGGGKRHHVG